MRTIFNYVYLEINYGAKDVLLLYDPIYVNIWKDKVFIGRAVRFKKLINMLMMKIWILQIYV